MISQFKFNDIPYTKVKCLKYIKNQDFVVEFKKSFQEFTYKKVNIGRTITRNGQAQELKRPCLLRSEPIISPDKVKYIRSMLQYIPEIARQYLRVILKMGKRSSTSSQQCETLNKKRKM